MIGVNNTPVRVRVTSGSRKEEGGGGGGTHKKRASTIVIVTLFTSSLFTMSLFTIPLFTTFLARALSPPNQAVAPSVVKLENNV